MATRASKRKTIGSRLRDWLLILIIALVAALLIRTFVFEAFRIPTPSMERSLLVGDYVLVSKLHFGPRTPVSLGVPFTDIYASGSRLPFTRIPGVRTIRRNDPIVFNHPTELGPIDRRTPYIKRVVGMPGDTLALRNKTIYIDGVYTPASPFVEQHWIVTKSGSRAELPATRLRELGIERASARLARQRGIQVKPNQEVIKATTTSAEAVARWPYVESVRPAIMNKATPAFGPVFPEGAPYNRDHYGPIYIPAAGDSVVLNESNWPLYRDLIERHERRSVRKQYDRFRIDGRLVEGYRFRQNYYFVMGDSRDNSRDSRSWGLVPEDHVIGRPYLIYMSRDPYRSFLGGLRLERFFKRVE